MRCGSKQDTVTAQRGDVERDYARINGLEIYYEVHGTGKPLVLLHGGYGSTGMFSQIMGKLSENRRVIAVDLQGHGRTAITDRPMTLDALADDVAELVHHLEYESADIMGYSLGGMVALRTAMRHPEVVERLVVVSAGFRRSGFYPEVRAGMDRKGPEVVEWMKGTPMYEAYVKVAPRKEDWPKFVERLGDLVRTDYDWSEDAAKLKMPVMLVYGDADAIRTSHAVEFFELLGGGKRDAGWDCSGMSTARLAILPGVTHYNIFMADALASTAVAFLDGPI
jgi:pimeloyl-ACP methyl ester carboxylesterase